jgi:hypothetical protein
VAFVLKGVLTKAEGDSGDLDPTELEGGVSFVPAPSEDISFEDGREWAAQLGRSLGQDRFAYVEIEFFGGVGSQTAVGWEDGNEAFGPLRTQTPGEDRDGGGFSTVPKADMAVNAVLRWLGIQADSGRDEFDTVGLSQRR